MTPLRRLIRDFFGFSRKETNGFILLLLIMAISISSEPLYRAFFATRPTDFSKDGRDLDSLLALWKKEEKRAVVDKTDVHGKNSVLTGFDPNTASEAELNKLGFSERLASRVLRYREKGGKFRVKSDLLKIYGMDSSLYRQLYTYIQLSESIKTSIQKYPPAEKQIVINRSKFDLNLADTAQLKKVYGIGPVLALRIVQYRQHLGGFIKQEQIKEVYGLDTSVVNRIMKVTFLDGKFQPEQVNINTASASDLNIHPYITKAMAKAVVAYRFQHGKFGQVEEIRNLQLFNEAVALKIMPYLKVAD
jgi:DNA uptake protein ComE-like DNA-binding protein